MKAIDSVHFGKNPWENLATAICIQAIEDYKYGYAQIKRLTQILSMYENTIEDLKKLLESENDVRERESQKKRIRKINNSLIKYKRNLINAQLLMEDAERFFKSDWCMSLTKLDGGVILREVKERCKYEESNCDDSCSCNTYIPRV